MTIQDNSQQNEQSQPWDEWLSPSAFNEKHFPNSTGISITHFIDTSSSTKINAHIEAMYIFLDNSQMKLFAESEHSYLITTVRYHPFYSLTTSEQNISLSLFEPVKELVWMAKRSDISKRNDWFNFTNYKDANDTEIMHLGLGKKKEIISPFNETYICTIPRLHSFPTLPLLLYIFDYFI